MGTSEAAVRFTTEPEPESRSRRPEFTLPKAGLKASKTCSVPANPRMPPEKFVTVVDPESSKNSVEFAGCPRRIIKSSAGAFIGQVAATNANAVRTYRCLVFIPGMVGMMPNAERDRMANPPRVSHTVHALVRYSFCPGVSTVLHLHNVPSADANPFQCPVQDK